MDDHSEKIAAIDIGTNSIRLVVVEATDARGPLKIIEAEREVIRLGSGSTDMKYISRDAAERAMKVLARYKAIVDSRGAYLHAVATSAVREAINKVDFLNRIYRELKIKVNVISGFEEARLIYLGILQALPVFGQNVFLVDIGGGSTEFLIGNKGRVLFDSSLKIGAIRLYERFFSDRPVSRKTLAECGRYISGMFSTIKRQAHDTKYDVVVGTSGTILNLANMIAVRRRHDSSTGLNNFSFTKKELFGVVDEILNTDDIKERSRLPGLDPKRADIIVPGAMILKEFFAQFDVNQMVVSEYSLKEGVIAYLLTQRFPREEAKEGGIREQSVVNLAENFCYELRHSRQVERLSGMIFDQTAKLHGLGASERELLKYAAILHDIGLFISRSQHHRHSYYIIRNAELLGFTENEKEMIANIARYHRKSHPKSSHEGFFNLDDDGKKTVKALAAILRIADGLDRGHSGSVKDIQCKTSGRSLDLYLYPNGDRSLDLEFWGAERKKQLFEEMFGLSTEFKCPSTSQPTTQFTR